MSFKGVDPGYPFVFKSLLVVKSSEMETSPGLRSSCTPVKFSPGGGGDWVVGSPLGGVAGTLVEKSLCIRSYPTSYCLSILCKTEF